MVLPTRVNIINDSGERIKVKIDNDRDRKFDEIINIEPGGRLDGIEGSVSGSGRFDVIVDIIINPSGPDNNIRLGGFKFDNPAFGTPYVTSSEFRSPMFKKRLVDSLLYDSKRDREQGRTYWVVFDETVKGDLAAVVNSARKPTFTIEPFFNDSAAGAKVWDLRINSDNFTL